MALMITTYDLPPADRMDEYSVWAKGAIRTVLGQPGVKEWRGYRNPFHITPEIMTCLEFDSLASCLKWIESEENATMAAEMKAMGCQNASVQLWAASPFAAEPLKPSGT